MIKVKEIEIAKEVKWSDGWWRFARGDVYDKDKDKDKDDANELSGKLSDYWWQTCFVDVWPPATMARLAACLKEFNCWESFLERKKVVENVLYLQKMGLEMYQDVDWERCNCTQNGWGQAR